LREAGTTGIRICLTVVGGCEREMSQQHRTKCHDRAAGLRKRDMTGEKTVDLNEGMKRVVKQAPIPSSSHRVILSSPSSFYPRMPLKM